MIVGKELWDFEVSKDLYEKTLSDNTVIETYKALPQNLYEALEQSANRVPNAPAITDNYGRTYSYKEYLSCCDELAAYLYFEKGIRSGSHVGLMMYNCFEFCVAFVALGRLGAVTVPLPSKFKKAEVLPLAKRAEIEALICDADYEAWFTDICPAEKKIVVKDIESGYGYRACYEQWQKLRKNADMEKLKDISGGDSEAAAIIMFTSGTTSQSKGVVLRNYNIMHAIEVYRRTLKITEKDISAIATPIYHVTGLIALLGLFIYTGARLYIHKFFDAERIVREAREEGFTFIHASPTVFNLLIQAGEKTPEIESLVSFACGSSNMPKEKLTRLHKWLPNSKFHTVYGLTETSSPATVFPEDAASSRLIGSSGIPVPGTRFKIVDDDRNELKNGEVGEIAVSGTVVVKNYYKQTDKSLEDGWLYTGDLGYFTEENYLYVVDRKKNMINRGGEKIWCYDVENEISSIAGVSDCAVVGIPDELYGEVAAAIVVPETGTSVLAESIQNYLKNRMAKYKIPVKIRLVDEVPQTPNGKTDKIKIKKMLMEEE